MYPKLFLKAGKEKAVRAHHHWVFSGAIMKKDARVESGGVVDVYSADHQFLGSGVYNEKTSIAVRMLTFQPMPVDGIFFWDRIRRAWELRQALFPGPETTAYRLCFSEGDFLPGLIVDRYGDGLVIQILTLGLDRFRDTLLEVLAVMHKPAFIYERSEGPARREEGLEDSVGLRYGVLPETGIEVLECGVQFRVDVAGGQKTGFFLDQRDNRTLVRKLAEGGDVLNCFGYTGGFAVCAAMGGAGRTVTVESSGPALEMAQANFALNGIPPERHLFLKKDVFQYLREEEDLFDLVVLDPPAFAKKQSALNAAYRGYKDINLHAIRRVSPGGRFLTCSCSHFLEPDMFQKILFGAAVDAGREVQILQRLSQPADHPVNVFHPESEYLKAFLCRVL